MSDLDAPALLQGRYELGPVLGTGGMARVHRGRDTVLDRPVAVKLFRAEVATEDAARIESESRTLAALNHPGLVSVYDAGTADPVDGIGSPYLVMELVDGPTLASCCTDGSLSTGDVLRIGAELAAALAHVHAAGIVHRDIKPANILLDRDRRPKLTDFGIARLVDGARHTATGLTIGTAPYLSPEQVTGEPVGPASDVYALGLVLLECLTGQREYPGAGAESAVARLHRPPRVPAGLPPVLGELLTAMTDLDPARRPTAAAVSDALRDIADAPTVVAPDAAPTRLLDSGDAGVGSGPVDELVGGVRRHRSAALVAAAALLLLLVVVVVRTGGGTAPSPQKQPPGTSQLERDLRDLQQAVTP